MILPSDHERTTTLIVSRAHGFIFLKARKVAGSSVELGLSPLLGPDDIYAPTTAEEDGRIRAEVGGRDPQNYGKPMRMWSARDYARLVVKRRQPHLNPHAPAKVVRNLVGERMWGDSFTFTVSRNPWDAMISHYWFIRGSGRLGAKTETMTIEGFLDTVWARRLALNSTFATIAGEMAVDYICRFERLESDLGYVHERIGLESPAVLPRAKSSTRTDHRHYTEVLTKTAAERIEAMFPFETQVLSYRYGE